MRNFTGETFALFEPLVLDVQLRSEGRQLHFGQHFLALPAALLLHRHGRAARVFARQFNALLEETGLKMDAVLQTQRTIYSLRHTAICMRIILSQGKVNIFNLAKNAGTSVNQIERFYARNLPLSPELAKNLQSFGE